MVNVNKLKGKLVENGLTIAETAEKINVNPATLYRKISNNGESITVKEATMLSEILHLTSQEINDIFFASVVA